MMKPLSLAFAILATSTAAFAPSHNTIKRSALSMSDEASPPIEAALPAQSQSLPFLARPAFLDGSLAGDVGFDPLGFAKSESDLMNYREAEIKHARLAMLAAAGWPLSELFDKKIAAALGMDPLLDSADRVPSLLNGGLGKVSPAYWAGAIGFAAIVEILGSLRMKSEKAVPGDFGLRLGYPSDEAGQQRMQLAEIKNGRLAMIAIFGFAIQEFVSKQGVINETPRNRHPAMASASLVKEASSSTTITTALLLCAIIIADISPGCGSFLMPRTTTRRGAAMTPPLRMGGLFDYVRENFFLDSRRGDFAPLEREGDGDDGANAFGPGPLILLYAVHDTMLDDDELLDMVEDGMPSRGRGSVVVRRIPEMSDEGGDDFRDELLGLSVGEALNRAMSTANSTSAKRRIFDVSPPPMVQKRQRHVDGPCPVIYFSGVTNAEMMDTYKILANKIYSETNGAQWPACAKAVPGAIGKSLEQVITEISGDHADAMRMSTSGADVDG
ncbi:hypothetical protein ACHAW5_005631 [Stephanodiscus triporus]|uniref:Uncharacterized protein n=1 Tax=Stephanodiscus triporus TaxID=2934178 RepID=A0ABD3MSZ2_9STRA